MCHQREDESKKKIEEALKGTVTMQVEVVEQRPPAEETSSLEKSGRRLSDLHWSLQLAGAP